jgi:hypothetical protein
MREGGAQALLGGWRPTGPFPEIQHFFDGHGGWMLLCHYTGRMLHEGARTHIVPLAIDLAAFGKRFGVSRTHLRRMLDNAYDQGLLAEPPRSGASVRFSARMIAAWLAAHAGELGTYRRAAYAARVKLGLAPA